SRVLVNDGAVATPTIAFTSATFTGLSRSGSGSGEQLNFSIAGTQKAFVTSMGLGLDDQSSVNFGILSFSGTAMTANRTLTTDLNNANRTLAMSGNLTVESASIINQDYSSDSTTVKWPRLTFDFTRDDFIILERDTGSVNTFAIQSQTSGAFSVVELFSKDGDGTDIVGNQWFAHGKPDDISNFEVFNLRFDGSSKWILYSDATGAGTIYPISIYTGLNTTQLVLNTDNSIDMSGDLTTANFTTASATVDSIYLNNSINDWFITSRAGQSLAFQNQNTGRTAEVEIYTFDDDSSKDTLLRLFPLGTPSDITHSESLRMGFDQSFGALSDIYLIQSTESGTGVLHPIHIFADGGAGADQFILNIDGNNSMSGDLSLPFGDFVSEQNPDGADAIRIKGTDYIDIVIGG
ncbi:hypothetical protein LCGC14_2812000, partial [marine sediment metagenome]